MKAVPLAIMMLAILGASMLVLVDSEESDAAQTLNLEVGTQYNTLLIPTTDVVYTANDVPGMTLTISGGNYYLTGTPTTPGTFSVDFYDGGQEEIESYTVIVVDNQMYEINISSTSGGSVSQISLDVRAGTRYYASGNTLVIGTNRITATPTDPYAFFQWQPSSGTIRSPTNFIASFIMSDPINLTMSQNYNMFLVRADSMSVSEDIPGMNVTYTSGNYYLTGAPTRAGNYSIAFYVPGVDSEEYSWSVTVIDSSIYEVLIASDDGGTVSQTSLQVPAGTAYRTNGNTLVIGTTTITATPLETYEFFYWDPNGTGTISSARTFTARFILSDPVTLAMGQTYNLFMIHADQMTVVASIPGMNVTYTSGNYYLTGTPTTTGSYSIGFYAPGTDTEEYSWSVTVLDTSAYTVTIGTTPGGTVSQGSMTAPSGTQFVSSGNTLTVGTTTITATPSSGYSFDAWDPLNGRITSPMTITAQFIRDSPISLTMGQTYNIFLRADRDVVFSNANIPGMILNNDAGLFYIEGKPTRAGTYSIDLYDAAEDEIASWTVTVATGPMTSSVHWSNNNFNGKIDILFSFRSGTDHTVTADLYAGTVDDNGLTTWAPSGYKAQVTLSFTNTLHAEAKILRNGAVWSGHAGVSDPGAWSRVLLSLDSENGRITLTPVRSFTSFTSFSLYESQERVIIDWPETTTGTATSVITHEDDGSDHARFAVVASRPFLNSYGVILYNPTINVRDYFPQYDSVRLNLFSFALYGTSMTINGHTWPVTDGKVTVQYVDLGDNQHFTPDADPTSPVKTRTFSLSNIYITWDNGRAALTFVDNRFTLDLGDYPLNQETMSFSGLWYFTTMLYEPYTAVEKTLGDWKPFPETSAQQMILIFMGITLVAGVAGMVHVRRTGRGTVDMVVIGGALLIAFIMLGAWYRCFQYLTYRI